MFPSRKTDDPLLRIFLDRYQLNLLTIPRENASIGDLYVYDGKRVSPPGKITNLIDPPFEIPSQVFEERLSEVSGVASNLYGSYSHFGLNYLTGFLNGIGGSKIIPKLQAWYSSNKIQTIRYKFNEPTREYADPLLIGREINNHRISEGHASYDENYRYYLVTGVARTSSLSIVIAEMNGKDAGLNINSLAGEGSSEFKTKILSKNEVTFEGEKKLAFGVELYQLLYDKKNSSFKFRMPTEALKLRTKIGSEDTIKPKPAFIGGSEGAAFIEIA